MCIEHFYIVWQPIWLKEFSSSEKKRQEYLNSVPQAPSALGTVEETVRRNHFDFFCLLFFYSVTLGKSLNALGHSLQKKVKTTA